MIEGDKAYVGNVALDYDRDRVSEPLWACEQQWMAAYLAELPRNATLLDAPVGTGRFFELFKAAELKVTGVDISLDMLKVASTRANELGVRVVLDQASIDALRFPDQSFDYVCCWRLFHLLAPERLDACVRQLARIVKRELVIEVVGVVTRPERVLRHALHVARRLARYFRSDRDVGLGQRPWSDIKSFVHSEGTLRRCFRGNGLTVSSVQTFYYSDNPTRKFSGLRVLIYRLCKA